MSESSSRNLFLELVFSACKLENNIYTVYLFLLNNPQVRNYGFYHFSLRQKEQLCFQKFVLQNTRSVMYDSFGESVFFFFFFFFYLPFQTGFLCISLAVLELTLQTRLSSNSEVCLPLPPECWITVVYHHCWIFHSVR